MTNVPDLQQLASRIRAIVGPWKTHKYILSIYSTQGWPLRLGGSTKLSKTHYPPPPPWVQKPSIARWHQLPSRVPIRAGKLGATKTLATITTWTQGPGIGLGWKGHNGDRYLLSPKSPVLQDRLQLPDELGGTKGIFFFSKVNSNDCYLCKAKVGGWWEAGGQDPSRFLARRKWPQDPATPPRLRASYIQKDWALSAASLGF